MLVKNLAKFGRYAIIALEIDMADNLLIIENLIYELRGAKVMIDSDLAKLYGVEVKRLNEAVKRNIERFPDDFMFRLSEEEWQILRSQFATFASSSRKYKPYAFTEHGVLMLSNILNSKQAIDVSIQIIRVFNRLRHIASLQTSSDKAISELRTLLMLHIENTDNRLSEQEDVIKDVILALNNLLETPSGNEKIGFRTD